MTVNIPKGWIQVLLNEVNLPVENIDPTESPHTRFTYFDIGSIDGDTNRITQPKIIVGRDAPSRARQSVRKNDILFSTVRTYLKKIAAVEEDYTNPIASTGFAVIRPVEGVSPRFVYFQLLSDGFMKRVNALQTGTSYPAVRSKDVFNQPILIAPMREQEQIAARLDTSFSRIMRSDSAAHRALNRLQRYRIAVVRAAVTGELTRDWRTKQRFKETGPELLQRVLRARQSRWEKSERHRLRARRSERLKDLESRYPKPLGVDQSTCPAVPNQWTWATLEELTLAERPITYGILMPKQNIPSGVPYVKVRDMKNDTLDVSNLERTSPEIAEKYARSSLRKGDLILAIRGTFGRVVVVPRGLEGGNITQDSARIAVTKDVDTSYVMWAIRSDYTQSYLQKTARGIAVKGVNIRDVRQVPLPLPPLIEQKEIVRQIERRLAAADRVAATLEEQFERARATRQALLRDAFTGRLVAADAENEPVSTLIARIRAENAARATKPKVKRMRRTKSKTFRRPLLDVLREHNRPITPEELFAAAGFQAAEADLFYRELASLRDMIHEERPSKRNLRTWPTGAKVLIGLKEKEDAD